MTNKRFFTELPPLSLYVHIPWCARKCPYCDFNSHTATAIPEREYVAALIADLHKERDFVQARELQSIFFGGGTPSLFSAAALNDLLAEIEKCIPFSADIEITLEANPGTAEQKKFRHYRAAGINRLSIGVQSFKPAHLQSLGRIHDDREAIDAIQTAKRAGFTNINIDLMHGLPAQTISDALQDIEQAIALAPNHISWYQLTIEPNTAFYNSPPQLPGDNQLADIQSAGEQMLSAHNFNRYEVSAYCQPCQQAKHNQNYWLFGDYIGIGAGAHGKVTVLQSRTIQRRWKTRSPKDYLAKALSPAFPAAEHETPNAFLAGQKTVSCDDTPLEFFMNSLRLCEGFQKQLFEQRTGLPLSYVEEKINRLIERGLLVEDSDIIKTSALGAQFLNNVLAEF